MKSRKTYSLLLPLIFAVVFSSVITSCNNAKKKATNSIISEETITKDIEEYAYPLVSTFDITKMLNEIEASYIAGIANDPANVESYFTERNKALNLGVYTADLAYSTTYNQKAYIQEYFSAIETLIGDLDMTAAFSSKLADEIEANIDNNEKMVEIISKISNDVYLFLNKQGRTELSYLILAGTAIEGLYLTTHISENTFQNPKIIETILYQKAPLIKLEGLMKEFRETDLSKNVYQNIKEINSIFNLNDETTAMTLEQIEELTKSVEFIRIKSVQ